MCVVFFFFKQKTAYELRISDWSSDVCSSDLGTLPWLPGGTAATVGLCNSAPAHRRRPRRVGGRVRVSGAGPPVDDVRRDRVWPCCLHARGGQLRRGGGDTLRSEEHTSELQSLMRISYAVFCLKKKTNTVRR